MRRTLRNRWSRRQLVLLVVLVGHVAMAVVSAQRPMSRPTPSIPDERAIVDGYRLDALERFMTDQQTKNFEIRLGILENEMGELKWLARAAALGVIGQIMLGLFERRRYRAQDVGTE